MKKFITLNISIIISTLVIIPNVGASLRDPGLPNSKQTPGANNPAVTQSNIYSTICVSGYTKTIRPHVSYTNHIKYSQLDSGYNNKGDIDAHNYEEDHLVPFEVGGNPSSVKNLWPEPWLITWNAGKKDQLENKMHSLVCNGSISLVAAQKVFMVNWISGYKKFIGK